MMTLSVRLALVALFGAANAYVLKTRTLPNETDVLTVSSHELVGRAADPTDFGWIKRWAAVGDSFTAGIGSGSQLGGVFHNHEDWKCSRYDQSYPMVLNRAFGPAVTDFQFSACSGDRSGDIYERVNAMDGNLNLVIMTAGGNDLCLVSVLFPYGFLTTMRRN
jgi:lysophospholipase L1-like esterase